MFIRGDGEMCISLINFKIIMILEKTTLMMSKIIARTLIPIKKNNNADDGSNNDAKV